MRFFLAALRRENFYAMASTFGQHFFQQFPIFKFRGNVNHFREIVGFEIKLLQQRRDEFLRIKFVQIFPVKFAAVHHAAAAQVKEVCGDERRFGVIGKHVGVVALGCGDALAFFDVFERAEQVAIRRSLLVHFFFGGSRHSFFQALDQIVPAAFEQESHIARRLRRSARRW